MKKLLDEIKCSTLRVKAYRLARWDNHENYKHDNHVYKVSKQQKILFFLLKIPVFLFVMFNFIFDSVYNPSTAMYLVGVGISATIMYVIIVGLRIAFLRESDNNQIK